MKEAIFIFEENLVVIHLCITERDDRLGLKVEGMINGVPGEPVYLLGASLSEVDAYSAAKSFAALNY